MESEQVLQSKNDSGGEKDVSKKKSCREKGNFFLLFTLAFLSLLPYVIPFGTPEHQVSAEEIAYENSSFFLVDAMSLERPEKASSLVLFCGAVYPPPFRFLMGLLQFPPAQRWLALIVNRGLLTQDRVEELLVSAYGRIPSPEETAGYYLPLTIKGTEITMVELNTGTTLNMAVHLAERLGEVKLEAICIWGENDTWVPLAQGERLSGDLPCRSWRLFLRPHTVPWKPMLWNLTECF